MDDGRMRVRRRFDQETPWMTRVAIIKSYLIVRFEGSRQLVRITYRFANAARCSTGGQTVGIIKP